jgi:hypothetical protein
MPLFPVEAGQAPITWSTAVALGLVLLIKLVLRLPKDWFQFREERRQDDAGEVKHDGYGELVDTLRDEITRLANTVNALSLELAKERQGRYLAEDEVVTLRREIQMMKRDNDTRDTNESKN